MPPSARPRPPVVPQFAGQPLKAVDREKQRQFQENPACIEHEAVWDDVSVGWW